MENLWSVLYNAVCNEATGLTELYTSMAGHQFEDKIAQIIKNSCTNSAIKYFPPRYMLDLPTFSGVKHQVDCLFVQGRVNFWAVECKRRAVSTKIQMYYFNGLITDYVMGIKLQGIKDKIRGIYMSTASIKDRLLAYCLSYGIRVIHPNLPPIEHMIQTSRDSSLQKELRIILSRIPEFHPLYENSIHPLSFSPLNLVHEYKDLVEKWKRQEI